ncbi:S-adenosyl-L-methionine-dependent methyltransferase [Phaeosphaeria sp. MPI-PUGE-AT-0046c]|nr:S-adenosyl-L-methionine-dependent methyltransferase [Phaeosphaeria sp. MPI-PUGE-AT-0046c]
MTSNAHKADEARSKESKLEAYYNNVQTLFWFDHVLGGARHFGYYKAGTKLPFPIRASLLRMEEQLYKALQLPTGARVLDAGCGAGHVSEYMARQGLHVTAIDIVPRHIGLTEKTKSLLSEEKDVQGTIEVQLMDYHHLEALGTGSTFEGIYTIEALVHATDPMAVLSGFMRQLKPGGRIVMHEYEHDIPEADRSAIKIVNDGFSMPMHEISRPGVMKEMLERAGFRDIEMRDLSQNVRPMTRMNYAISIVPYILLKPLGLVKHSLNAVAGVQLHRNLRRGNWKYVQIFATKPVDPSRVE